jgi:nucleotide-binding universal stress UspA family protein
MKVLLAVDGSPYSDEAIRRVAERPWSPGTIVRVLSVAERVGAPPVGELMYGVAETAGELQQEIKAEANDITGRAASILAARGIAAEETVREGDPRMEIVKEAGEWDADLIVVGSHGYTGLKRLVLGSVAQSIVSHAPCSVEVVRAKADKR